MPVRRRPPRTGTARPARGVAAVLAAVGLIAVASACTSAQGGDGQRASSAPTSSSTARPASSTPAQPGPTIAPAAFSNCATIFNPADYGVPPSRRSRLQISCGRIMVPLDYSHPQDTQIPIQLIRIHSTGQSKPLGSLLVNPGGPGGSGVIIALELAGTVSDSVLDRYDLVGFDPRGVSLSGPVKCLSPEQTEQQLAMTYDVRTAAGVTAADAVNRSIARSCQDKYGSDLTEYTTVNTARDMDLIRQAVGDTQLHYLGFSYGTELGGVYAHLFPTRVATMVLDGAVDPTTEHDPVRSGETQLKGFEEAFGQYADGCTKRSTCRTITDPQGTLLALEQLADSRPIPTSVSGDTRTASGGIVLSAALSALYSQSEWSSLDTALVEAQHGDAKGLFALVDEYAQRDSQGTYTNLLDMLQVVSCNDSPTTPTDAQIRATATRWAEQYPVFGLYFARQLTGCAGWPGPRTPPPDPTAPGARPILVLGNLNDPATPYVGSQNLVRTLGGGARLLTWNGEGHTSFGQSACIDTAVDAYLTAGTLPAAGTVCQ